MSAQDYIEKLISLAYVKGLFLRKLKGIDNIDHIGQSVGFCCGELDKLGIKWAAQNDALEYINNVDDQRIWERLHKSSFKRIAANIMQTNSIEVK